MMAGALLKRKTATAFVYINMSVYICMQFSETLTKGVKNILNGVVLKNYALESHLLIF